MRVSQDQACACAQQAQGRACVYRRPRATTICSGRLHSSCIQENMLTTRSASTLIRVCTVPPEKPAMSAVLTISVLSKTRQDSAARSWQAMRAAPEAVLGVQHALHAPKKVTRQARRGDTGSVLPGRRHDSAASSWQARAPRRKLHWELRTPCTTQDTHLMSISQCCCQRLAIMQALQYGVLLTGARVCCGGALGAERAQHDQPNRPPRLMSFQDSKGQLSRV